MSSLIDISNLTNSELLKVFTNPGAEFETEIQNQGYANEYYIPVPYLYQIRSGDIVIVHGRRGTGKTKTLQHLISNSDKSNKVISIKNWDLSIFENDSDLPLMYRIEELVLETLMLNIIESEHISNKIKNKIFTNNFITKAIESHIIPPVSWRKKFLPSLKKKIKGISIKGMDIEFQVEDDPRMYNRELRSLLNELSFNLHNHGVHITLIADEIDEFADKPYYLDIINTLIDITAHFLQDFSGLSFTCFMRTDVYNIIKSHHQMSRLTGSIIDLNQIWTTHQLREMMSKRLNIFCKNNISRSKRIQFKDLIPDNPPVSIMSQHGKVWDYLLQRTFYRPRDVIKFAYSIIEEFIIFKQSVDYNSFISGPKFSEIVRKADKRYSSALIDDINREFQITIKNKYDLDSLQNAKSQIQDYFLIIRQHGQIKIKFSHVQNIIKSNSFWSSNIKQLDIFQIFEDLYHMSLIGKDLKTKSQEGFFHIHSKPYKKEKDDTEYIVHHGIRRALGINN